MYHVAGFYNETFILANDYMLRESFWSFTHGVHHGVMSILKYKAKLYRALVEHYPSCAIILLQQIAWWVSPQQHID